MTSSLPLADVDCTCPSEWRVVPLPDAVTFQEGPGILAKDFRDSGVPLIRLKGVEGDFVTLAGCNFLDPEVVARRWNHFRLELGDLVISTSASFGRVSEVTSDAIGAIPYTGLIRFRPKGEVVDREFLRAFLGSTNFMQQVEAMASGSVIRHFGPTHLKQMTIQVPPLEEQREMGALYSVIADRQRLLSATNDTLEAIAQALFKSWFVDFDPVRAKAEGCAPEGMDAATAALFPSEFEDSELGRVPKGWRVLSLGDALTVLETGRRPKGGVAGIAEGVPSIGAESINGIGVFDFSKTKFVPEDFFTSMKSGKPEPLDILLYKDGGKPGEFKPRLGMYGEGFPFEEFAINEHVFLLRAGPEIGSQLFLYFWLKEERQLNQLRHAGNKAAIPGINRGDVGRLLVLAPSAEALAKFHSVASATARQILVGANRAHSLAQLRDALLPRLISGQLRLPEATKAAEVAPA